MGIIDSRLTMKSSCKNQLACLLLISLLWPVMPVGKVTPREGQKPAACCCPSGQCQMAACPGNTRSSGSKAQTPACSIGSCSHSTLTAASIAVLVFDSPRGSVRMIDPPDARRARPSGHSIVLSHSATPLHQPPQYA